jgi:chaperonin GroES
MNLTPTSDRVIIQPNPISDTTPGGIIIPETVKEKPRYGTVVAVGPGKYNPDFETACPVSLKVGDTVLFAKYSGSEVTVDGVDYLIMREDDVIAVQKR